MAPELGPSREDAVRLTERRLIRMTDPRSNRYSICSAPSADQQPHQCCNETVALVTPADMNGFDG